jgi:Ca2+-binding EF-hand superfamily protein
LDHLISAIVAACQEGVRIKKPEEMGITNPKVSLPKKDLESASSAQHLFHCELRRLSMTYTGEELFTAAVRRSHLDAPGVSYEGLRSLVSEIFWRKLSDEQLRTVFSHVDKDKSGIINAREFGEFLEEMNELGDINKREAGDAVALDEEMDFSFHSDQAKLKGAVKYEHFRIMYCGGSLPVVKALKDVSTAHNIPLELENFSW